MFKNDILYWDKLYSLFSPIPENATQVKSYLVNRLFNFIADNISSISHIHSLTNCLSIVNDIEKNINTDFFRTNFKHINSTFWQRFLIFISPKLYCTVIYLLQKKWILFYCPLLFQRTIYTIAISFSKKTNY